MPSRIPSSIWRKAMQLKNKIKMDRSGKISTILLAVIVIIVVVIVAVALYVVLSGDNNNETEQEIAPGTVVEYNVEGVPGMETLKMEYIGQNIDNYFIKSTVDGAIAYYMSPKDYNIDDYNFVGTQEMSTCDGDMTIAIVEYSDGTISYTEYDNPETGLPYMIEYSGGMILTLKGGYVLKTQDMGSYRESDAIGTTNTFALVYTTETDYTAKSVCVADCQNGQYGIMYDFTSVGGPEVYAVSDSPQGLPTDAEDSGYTYTAHEVTFEVWYYTDNSSFMVYLYYDPDSGIIGDIGLDLGDGTMLLFELMA